MRLLSLGVVLVRVSDKRKCFNDVHLELRRLFIFLKLDIPLLAARQGDASDRLPLSDGQAGLGETGDATDDDDAGDEGGDGVEPLGDGWVGERRWGRQ